MFRFTVDTSKIADMVGRVESDLIPSVKRGVQDLSVQTHSHIVEKVQNSLHSSREIYNKNLHYTQVSDSTFVISLNREAWWIEDGIPPGTSMVDWLLRQAGPNSKPPKTAKDGSQYRVIPFMHNKGPASQTETQQELTRTIRNEMSRRGIPYSRIEMNGDGTPKTGRLHSFDIMDKPVKTKHGVGQGWGEIGKARVGATGIPFLQNVTIYQKQYKNTAGETRTQKQIMTFRIVSSKHKDQNRWVHPGFEPKEFLKEGYEWAQDEWERKYLPEIMAGFTRL